MAKFLLYAVLVFFLIQLVRTTMRIRSQSNQWKEEHHEEDPGKPPVLNIPDIQDASFEDLPNEDSGKKEHPKDRPKDSPSH